MSKRDPGAYERRENDFYPTPTKLVAPLIPHLRAAGVRRFSEPCAGNGALVRAFESFGLVCDYRGDLSTGQDAFVIERFTSPPLTNPPYKWEVLPRLIEHFLATAPFFWFLLKSDWMHNVRTQGYMSHCSDLVSVRRWHDPGTPSNSLDNFSWYRFCATHSGGPILRVGATLPAKLCAWEGPPKGRHTFVPTRSDAKFCDDTCRQRAHRSRIAVT